MQPFVPHMQSMVNDDLSITLSTNPYAGCQMTLSEYENKFGEPSSFVWPDLKTVKSINRAFALCELGEVAHTSDDKANKSSATDLKGNENGIASGSVNGIDQGGQRQVLEDKDERIKTTKFKVPLKKLIIPKLMRKMKQ